MPHVIIKVWPGKSEQQKTRLAEEIGKYVMDVFKYGEESVSVAVEEIQPQDCRLIASSSIPRRFQSTTRAL
jgi:4-oxalocrotonate tautomerase